VTYAWNDSPDAGGTALLTRRIRGVLPLRDHESTLRVRSIW
jgi:hypothetical protein